MTSDLCIVVATRNEADNIGRVINSAMDYGHVVVVDNVSTDRTVEFARDFGVTVIEHKEDTHIKQSYVDGFKWAFSKGFKRIVQLDAGLSFNPSQIARLIIHPNADLVIGQRFSRNRKPISLLGGSVIRTVTGMPFEDATSGFRLWKVPTLKKLDLDGLRCRAHGFQIELLWQAWKAGLNIVTVPVSYEPGTTSANKEVALEALRAVWRMRRWACGSRQQNL